MSPIFRHYRQVKIVSRGDSLSPQIRGMEEVYCNGQRQVRYWGDRPSLETEEFADLSLFDLVNQWERELPLFPVGESLDWLSSSYPHRYPRKINPDEVVIEPNQRRKVLGGKLLQKLQQVSTQGTRKIHKMFRNLPSALKLAWQELNQ